MDNVTALLVEDVTISNNQRCFDGQLLKTVCVFCCSQVDSPGGELATENEDTEHVQSWLTGSFARFCEDVATKSSLSGMTEAVGISLTPQLMFLMQKEIRENISDNVPAAAAISVCSSCKEMVNAVMEHKRKAAQIELLVISLQLQLLEALRHLKMEMEDYTRKYNRIENAVKFSDTSTLEERCNVENDLGGVGSCVLQLRSGIVNASNELQCFQDELSMKVDCTSLNTSTSGSNPLDYAVVKLEVDEDSVDEDLLPHDEFYTTEDFPEPPSTLNKCTQTTGYFPPISEDKKSFIPVRKRPTGMSKYKWAKLNRQRENMLDPDKVDPDAGKLFSCNLCKDRFSSKSTLESHHVKKHGAPKPKCPRCKKEFLNHVCLKVHLESHDNIKFYECDRCPKVFATSGQFNSHMESHR